MTTTKVNHKKVGDHVSEQYFTHNPQIKSDRKTWTFMLKGHRFTFTSDTGVFSKNEVDFGSRTLIDAFEAPEIEGDYLDLGCGYGPIGLSLAKADRTRNCHLVDVNERAIALAKENARVNQVDNVKIYSSDRFENVNQAFAAILTNPPIRAGKQTVHLMLEESFAHLLSGGALWVVIQKKQGAPSAIKKLEEFSQEVDVVLKNKGYYILRAVKK